MKPSGFSQVCPLDIVDVPATTREPKKKLFILGLKHMIQFTPLWSFFDLKLLDGFGYLGFRISKLILLGVGEEFRGSWSITNIYILAH